MTATRKTPQELGIRPGQMMSCDLLSKGVVTGKRVNVQVQRVELSKQGMWSIIVQPVVGASFGKPRAVQPRYLHKDIVPVDAMR